MLCRGDGVLSVKCTVRESLQLYSPTTASDGAAIPATVGDCLELRSQLTTDAYTLTLPVNSREATLVLSQLCSSIRLSFSPSRTTMKRRRRRKRWWWRRSGVPRVSGPLCSPWRKHHQRRTTERTVSSALFRCYLQGIHNRLQTTWTHFW